ncbi:hypothetical protein GMORB2_2559 [Geosmithia morbida]|uniref:Uncharacterized protein n=1 Tax=Geosmithia morbida TaxID=1094350 RepID=A0A9P4YQ49_9HYPO|nr:uncharacterized protein GMORB2_2559 [Geosmithia morbida]KAF4121073.1 hypothetical protein GMORB2_2559 [Geosmithia morbida]
MVIMSTTPPHPHPLNFEANLSMYIPLGALEPILPAYARLPKESSLSSTSPFVSQHSACTGADDLEDGVAADQQQDAVSMSAKDRKKARKKAKKQQLAAASTPSAEEQPPEEAPVEAPADDMPSADETPAAEEATNL